MSGSYIGGKKAAATNKKKYGESFYADIGRVGGKLGHTGGFYARRDIARSAGRKGGKISKRVYTPEQRQAMSKAAHRRLSKNTTKSFYGETLELGLIEGL